MYVSTTPIQQLDSAFNCFHPQVVFQDPLVRVHGRAEYEAQFRTLRALFTTFKPLSVEITGDIDKISMDMTVEWAGSWYSLKLRQVTIAHISDSGLGVISKHEDLWSWADVWLQMPVISFFYSRWRPFFGHRSSEAILSRAEKKGDQWVARAKNATTSQYTLPPQPEGGKAGEDEGVEDSNGLAYPANNGYTKRS